MQPEIQILKNEKTILSQQFGVDELAVFGSVARGDAMPQSDVDILVSLKKTTLSNYFALLDYLQSKLNRKVDLITKGNNLSDRFLKMINKDIIYV